MREGVRREVREGGNEGVRREVNEGGSEEGSQRGRE